MNVLETIKGLTPTDECRILARLASAVPADHLVVEIGVFRGKSLCWMAAAASAHVFGVDPWGLPGQTAYRGRPRKQAKFVQDTNYQVAMGAIRRAGLQDRATLVRGFSTDVAAKWADPRPIGLLYIDGDHRADAAYGDLIAWRPFLAPEAVVAWDDYWPAHPGVVEAVDQLVAEGILTDLRVEARRLAVTRLAP